ncbi:MAG: SAM-dependent methyltransferase, partial [Mesorhizobium sp.]
MQPIVDTSLWLAHKRRALANPAAGADFLMRRAAEELAERLGAVERKFDRAAVLFCQTPAAVEVLATSGKVADIVRVEADSAFLGDAAGVVAPLETV